MNVFFIYYTFVSFLLICGMLIIESNNLGIFSTKRLLKKAISQRKRRQREIKRITLKFIKKKKERRIEREIYMAASLLHNIAILQRKSPKGAIYTIEQLSDYVSELKPALDKMLHYLRLNQTEEGLENFENELQTKSSLGFGRILIKLDELNPNDLEETLIMYCQGIQEEAITREQQRNEILSDLMYIPVMMNVMIIFINFVYIAYFAEQKILFQQLF